MAYYIESRGSFDLVLVRSWLSVQRCVPLPLPLPFAWRARVTVWA